MKYLGIDYGTRRVGLAYADELGLALPLPAAVQPESAERLASIQSIILERKIDEIVLGYPYNMDGTVGFKAKEVEEFAEQLKRFTQLPLHFMDERLSSRVAAEKMKLRTSALRTVRDQQNFRKSGELDSESAACILQDYLDAHFGEPLLPPDL